MGTRSVGRGHRQLSPLGPEFSESNNALNTSLSGISNELSALNSELTGSNATLLSDVRAVNNQFMKVMNLFLNLLNNTQDVDYTDVFEDVSEETLQSATRGKVLECANYGAVTADRNAGGISGAMAIEYDADPEDDLLSSGKRSTRFTYQTKAILLDCNNYGTVQAKKSCAGGITGRMDLGTISGCGGWGQCGKRERRLCWRRGWLIAVLYPRKLRKMHTFRREICGRYRRFRRQTIRLHLHGGDLRLHPVGRSHRGRDQRRIHGKPLCVGYTCRGRSCELVRQGRANQLRSTQRAGKHSRKFPASDASFRGGQHRPDGAGI